MAYSGEEVVGISMDWKKGDRNAPYGQKLSPILNHIGFELETVSPKCIQGRFVVNERSAQAYGTLHGGISAFLVECLGSLGAYVASGFQQVAGVELSINHLRPAPIGSEVEVVAKPIHIGRRLHVWEVKLISSERTKQKSSYTSEPGLIATSKITMTVLPQPAVKSHNVERIHSRL
eukprot:Gb_12377 [translate_table: standard]